MTAEGMFKELGYEKNIDDFGIEYETGGIVSSSIYFHFSDKSIGLGTDDGWNNRYTGFTLSKDTYGILDAIQKQIEELEWNKE